MYTNVIFILVMLVLALLVFYLCAGHKATMTLIRGHFLSTSEQRLASLTKEHQRWCARKGYEQLCAEELLIEYADKLTRWERRHLRKYLERWDRTQEQVQRAQRLLHHNNLIIECSQIKDATLRTEVRTMLEAAYASASESSDTHIQVTDWDTLYDMTLVERLECASPEAKAWFKERDALQQE